MDLISIIIPIYNVELYLKRCVDSVLNQTYKNLEVILVDDGSPDKCGCICDEYAKNDMRIKVIHKKNGGLSDARNAGLSIASGRYVAFVDSDDYIDANMYDKLYEAIKKANADMAICNFRYVNENGVERFNNTELPIKDEILSGMRILSENMFGSKPGYWVVAWNKLYKRELFENIKYPVGKIHEDEFIIHKLFFKCNKIVGTSKILYNYVQRENSITNRKYNISRLDYIEALLDRVNFYIEKNFPQFVISKTLSCYRAEINQIYNSDFRRTSNFKKRYAELGKIYRELYSKLIRYGFSKKEKFVFTCLYISPFLLREMHKLKAGLNLIIYAINGRKNRFVLLDTPTHGNLGDHAIVMAEQQILKNMGNNYTEATANQINFHEKIFARVTSSKSIILIPGGGFLGSMWPVEEERFRRILKAFKKNKIIVCPQTVTFDLTTEEGQRYFEESYSIYSSAKNLTMFVREKKSYEFMKKYMPKVNVVLAPDLVTYLDVRLDAEKRKGILFCMRSDREKSIKDEDVNNIYELVKQTYSDQSIEYVDTVINKSVSVTERESEVRNILRKFKRAKLIVTDRLHGMVFAAITNTPCIAISNSNGKINGVYDWIAENKYIIYIDHPDAFKKALGKLDTDQVYQYDRGSLEKAFIPLFKSIDED